MSKTDPFISVVSPVYKASGLLSELVRRIETSLTAITSKFEIILVEDGSPDDSWKEALELASTHARVNAIKLSRNFGQHYAITAGLDHAKGDWVVVMDCDLQDQPEEIVKLFNKTNEGYDIVLAKREQRKDGFLKRISSRYFYTAFNYLTGMDQNYAVANFGIYRKKVIDEVRRMKEPIRFFPSMIQWVGFSKTYIPIDHGSNSVRKTSYSWSRLIRLALDIILTNSEKPIRLIIRLGFLITFVSFIIGIIIIYKFLTNKILVQGYTSILVSLWFIGGMVMFVLGVIGLYIGKIFEGVKRRPLYIIEENINSNDTVA